VTISRILLAGRMPSAVTASRRYRCAASSLTPRPLRASVRHEGSEYSVQTRLDQKQTDGSNQQTPATPYSRCRVVQRVGSTSARELKQLREENSRLKRLVADLTLDKAMLQDVVQKKW